MDLAYKQNTHVGLQGSLMQDRNKTGGERKAGGPWIGSPRPAAGKRQMSFRIPNFNLVFVKKCFPR